jgi:hypothetical protein
VQHSLQRLDLARQAAVLAVDEHGDQGRIGLGDGDGNDSLVFSSVKTLLIRKALMEKTLPIFRRTGFSGKPWSVP